MSDKKKVELSDLEAQGAEDVKGGAASLSSTFASININSAGLTAGRVGGIATGGLDIDKIKGIAQGSGTVMCPW